MAMPVSWIEVQWGLVQPLRPILGVSAEQVAADTGMLRLRFPADGADKVYDAGLSATNPGLGGTNAADTMIGCQENGAIR